MAKLIYAAIASLDGYVEDDLGGFAWAEPDEDLLAAVNEIERPLGTYLYGRRMYETMAYWETAATDQDENASEADSSGDRTFAELWRAADKVVYSRTLSTPMTARTRIEREFDPAAVRALKETSEQDLSVGGAELAAQAFVAGLVDEFHLYLHPVIVGGGKRALPALPPDARLRLELLGEDRFESGAVHVHYRVLNEIG